MDDIQKRLQYIKWLQSIGIEYYCSCEEKDSKNSLIDYINSNKILAANVDNRVEPEKMTSQKNKKASSLGQKHISNKKVASSAVDIARKLADAATSLDDLYSKLCDFDGCELKNFANNTVFADGKRDADILLVGEAPGATEDEKGIPFCGESGQLLDKMLATIGVSRRANAYITNTVFWRPPGNRRPTTEEIEICRPFVEKHIALKKPKLIILVGGTATTSLLDQDKTISKIRNEIYYYKNQYLDTRIHTTALFHPAYLLRQPLKKKDTWYDLLKIKEILTKLSIKI